MAFRKHRGLFDLEIEVADDERYTLTAAIPAETDFSRPLFDLAFPAAEGDRAVLTGWRGVNDTETGEPLPFEPAAAADFLGDACIEGAVWRALGKLRGEALSGELLRKNSKAPAATGRKAAPAATAPG